LPAEIKWLPKTFVEELNNHDCKIPSFTQWNGGIKIKLHGIIVGEFAESGQYDIAVMCNNKVLIHWGGHANCPSEINNLGETLSIPDEGEIQRYLKRYGNKEWPAELNHDPIGMYNLGKSSFYQYCHNGKWLFSDGAD